MKRQHSTLITWLGALVLAYGGAGCGDDGRTFALVDAAPTADAGLQPAADGGTTRCANSCAGSCVSGRCLSLLASDTTAPSHLVLVDDALAFTTCSDSGAGSVLRIARTQTQTQAQMQTKPTTLATGSCPSDLTALAADVYVAALHGDSIERVSAVALSSSATSKARDTIVEHAGAHVQLTTADATLYWNGDNVALQAIQLPNTAVDADAGTGDEANAPRVIAPAIARPTRPSVNAGRVYWGDLDRNLIASADALTNMASPTKPLTHVVVMNVDDLVTLVSAADQIYFGSGYVLKRAAIASGMQTTLATAAGAPIVALTVDEKAVYYTSYSNVWKVARDGSAMMLLANDQRAPSSIVVDDDSVYWTNRDDGSVMKLTPK